MYVQKISSNPDFYYIPFPKKSSDVYLEINLKSGFVQENNGEFGLGHLLEHYLIGLLNKNKITKNIDCNGTISKDTTNYYLKSSKSKILKEADDFLNFVLTPNFSDNNVFDYEKESIFNELKIKIGSLGQKSFELAMKNRSDKKCPYTRTSFEQLENLKNKKLEDIKNYHQKFFNYKNLLFTLSGYKLKKRAINQISLFIKNYKLSSKSLGKNNISCNYGGFKIIKQKEESLKDNIFVALSFPSFGAGKFDPGKRFELDALCEMLSGSKYGIFNEIRKIGIYRLEYEKPIWKNYGFVGFGTIIPPEKLTIFLEMFLEKIKKIKNGEISKQNLKKILMKSKKSSRESFVDNIKRLKWFTYDLIIYGKPTPLYKNYEEVKKITTTTIKEMARKILDMKLVNVIFMTQNTKIINSKKIKDILIS